MVDPVALRSFLYRALFVAVAAFLLFLRLLPLSTVPTAWPGPDLLLCLTVAWVLRRPDYVPALVVAAVFLVEDMLLMRPPGLWTVIVLLASEFLRDREATLRGLPFLVEWATVAVILAAMTLAERLVLAGAMVPQSGPGLTLMQLVATLAAYPLVALASHYALGLNRPSPGEARGLGSRL